VRKPDTARGKSKDFYSHRKKVEGFTGWMGENWLENGCLGGEA